MIHAEYESSDHCRKKLTEPATVGYEFFLQCRHLHIPHESPKKAFYCLDITQATDVFKNFFL